jgi:hypothetical protein
MSVMACVGVKEDKKRRKEGDIKYKRQKGANGWAVPNICASVHESERFDGI